MFYGVLIVYKYGKWYFFGVKMCFYVLKISRIDSRVDIMLKLTILLCKFYVLIVLIYKYLFPFTWVSLINSNCKEVVYILRYQVKIIFYVSKLKMYK